MQGATYSTYASLPALGDRNWRISGTGDFNGDGKADLVWRNYATGQNATWLLNGTTLLPNGGISLTAVGDLNWQIAGSLVRYGDPGVADTAGNTIATAFDIGTLTGQATYTDSVSSADDDYYKFTLLTKSSVRLALSGLTANGNIALSGNGITTLTGAGNPTRTIETSLSAGTYYVRIHQPDSVLSQYSVSLNAITIALVTATPLPDIGGNTPTTAFNIGTLNGKQTYIDSVDRTDDDYYTFTVTGNTFFDLWLDGLATTSLVLTGNGISFTPQSTGDQMKTITTSLAAGTYSIHISQAESNPSRYNLQLSPAPLSPSTLGWALGDFSYDNSSYGTAIEQQAYYYGYNASFHAALAGETYDVNRNVDWSQADPETAPQQSAAYAGGYEDGYWDAYFGKVYQTTYSSRLDNWYDNAAYAGDSANYSQWLQAYDQHYAYRLQHPTYENGSIYANPGSLNNYLMRLLKAFNAVPALAGQLQQLESLNTLIATGAFYAATQTALGQTAANLGPDGFFSAIWTARSVDEIDAAAATLAAYLNGGDDLLSLADYERRLLRAANLVPVLKEQMTDAAFVGELLGLGNVYASLNPTESTTSGEEPLQFFLHTSWQTQGHDGQARQSTARELETFLKEFDEAGKRVQLLGYEQKLLKTFKLELSLQDELQDALIVKQTLDLGSYFTKIQVNLNQDLPGSYLSRIWNSQSEAEQELIAHSLPDEGGYFTIDEDASSGTKQYKVKLPKERKVQLVAATIFAEANFEGGFKQETLFDELNAVGSVILNRLDHVKKYPTDQASFGGLGSDDTQRIQSIISWETDFDGDGVSTKEFPSYNSQQYYKFLSNSLPAYNERDAAAASIVAATSLFRGDTPRSSYPFVFFQQSSLSPSFRADDSRRRKYGAHYFWAFKPGSVDPNSPNV